jgi:methylenetetrahydrofolate dehydrogenase (NADP+)/methenyltetrahydrofolate cyclohydrolase
MIVDGRKIAEELRASFKKKVALLSHFPTLAVVMVGDDPASKQFVGIKKRFADTIGIPIQLTYFPKGTNTKTLMDVIKHLSADNNIGGVVVQLPLPEYIDARAILNIVPVKKDVDVLSDSAIGQFNKGNAQVLPPVVGAFAEILKRENFDIENKNVVVVGRGALVGKPAETWLTREGANVRVLDKSVDDISVFTQDADILILGAGSPGLITPDIIKSGVVLLDAGTSEAAGKLVGDADPACAEKCSVFTPVPGGIGPITVAMIFKNLLELNKISTQTFGKNVE